MFGHPVVFNDVLDMPGKTEAYDSTSKRYVTIKIGNVLVAGFEVGDVARVPGPG
jgi:hypothetical protein